MSKYKYFNKLCLLIIIRQHMFGKKAIFISASSFAALLFSFLAQSVSLLTSTEEKQQ